MDLNRFKTYLPKGEFAKNVLTLMTGTTIAQAIPIAISPILTRIYSPDDFGVLAIFMAITAITGSIANAKYEQAIILPKSDKEAINVLAIGVIIALALSFFLLFIILIFNTQIVNLLGDERIKIWLYFVPISTLFLGIYNSLNFYNIRKKRFKNISISSVTRSSSLGAVQVGIGLIHTSPLGLVVGQITSYFSGNLILYKALKENKTFKSDITKSDMKKLANRYKKFPIFSMPSIFVNALNLNIINFLISSIFSITTLGFYSLTQRIVGIPARVIGNSFSQVYFQRATQEFQKTGYTNMIFIKTLKKMILIALPIFIGLFFIAEPVFAFIFGGKWRIAGTYARILVPLSFVRFITTAMPTFVIHEKQQLGLIFNLLLLLITLIIFVIGQFNNMAFNQVLIIFSISLSLLYSLLLITYYKVSINHI